MLLHTFKISIALAIHLFDPLRGLLEAGKISIAFPVRSLDRSVHSTNVLFNLIHNCSKKLLEKI